MHKGVVTTALSVAPFLHQPWNRAVLVWSCVFCLERSLVIKFSFCWVRCCQASHARVSVLFFCPPCFCLPQPRKSAPKTAELIFLLVLGAAAAFENIYCLWKWKTQWNLSLSGEETSGIVSWFFFWFWADGINRKCCVCRQRWIKKITQKFRIQVIVKFSFRCIQFCFKLIPHECVEAVF